MENSNIKAYNVKEYVENFFMEDLKKFQKSCIEISGFPGIDTLYPKLYVFGGNEINHTIDFINQLVIPIVKTDRPVFYFSFVNTIRQVFVELSSKIMMEQDADSALTPLQIQQSIKNRKVPIQVFDAVSTYAKNIHMIDCDINTTVDDIVKFVDDFISETGTKPVIMIDHLQSLIINTRSHSLKQTIDQELRKLKQFQQEYELTVITVSSLNQNYKKEDLDMEDFAECGGVEHIADIIFGLQNKTRIPSADKIKLLCIKNNCGPDDFYHYYTYYRKFAYFKPLSCR